MRPDRFVLVAVFAVVAVGLAYLPVWPTSQMTRAQVEGHAGDVIRYHVGFESIPEQVRSLRYDGAASRYAWLGGAVVVSFVLAALAARTASRAVAGRSAR